MFLKGLILLGTLIASSTQVMEHPLKMTFSKLVVNPNGYADLETRIFLDDLTAHMQQLYGLAQPDFSTTQGDGTRALQNYLNQHFYLEQDGKRLSLSINAVSLSSNNLALVVNLNSNAPLDASKEVIVFNTLLCDATITQVNNIKYQGEIYPLSISKPKAKIDLQ